MPNVTVNPDYLEELARETERMNYDILIWVSSAGMAQNMLWDRIYAIRRILKELRCSKDKGNDNEK